MLPFRELAALLAAPDLGRSAWAFPAVNAHHFSAPMALALLEVAVQAQARQERLMAIRDHQDLFLACGGGRDATSLFDVRGDMHPQPLPFGEGRVYAPFLHSFRPQLDLLPGIAAGARQVWLTGHGLGAADALLAAAHLQSAGIPVAAVYTFGAPRVGDKRFSGSMRMPVFRVVNGMDVVATLPPPWHYRHTGRHLLLNDQGRLFDQPGPLARLPDLARQSGWLSNLLLQGLRSGYPRPLHSLLRTVLTDHSPAAYLDRVGKLAAEVRR